MTHRASISGSCSAGCPSMVLRPTYSPFSQAYLLSPQWPACILAVCGIDLVVFNLHLTVDLNPPQGFVWWRDVKDHNICSIFGEGVGEGNLAVLPFERWLPFSQPSLLMTPASLASRGNLLSPKPFACIIQTDDSSDQCRDGTDCNQISIPAVRDDMPKHL